LAGEGRAQDKTLAMIHTVAGLAGSFGALAREMLPGLPVFHLVDEGLLGRIIREGQVTAAMCRRIVELAANAEQDGADVILLTCSAMSPAVDVAAPLLNIPIFKVDQPMVRQAVAQARRIGVFATVPATLQSVSDLVRREAAEMGREVAVITSLRAEAMAAARAGRREEHDALVREALLSLARQVDVVLVAQASAAEALRPEDVASLPAPVLTSPRLALARLRDWLSAED